MYLLKFALRALITLATVAMLTTMIITGTNIVGRYFFRLPILGAIEIAGLGGAIMVAISLLNAQIEDCHVKTSIVFDLLPKRLQSITEKFTLFLSAAIVGVFSYCTAMSVYESVATKESAAILNISIWPFRLVLLIACIFLFALILRQLISFLFAGKQK